MPGMESGSRLMKYSYFNGSPIYSHCYNFIAWHSGNVLDCTSINRMFNIWCTFGWKMKAAIGTEKTLLFNRKQYSWIENRTFLLCCKLTFVSLHIKLSTLDLRSLRYSTWIHCRFPTQLRKKKQFEILANKVICSERTKFHRMRTQKRIAFPICLHTLSFHVACVDEFLIISRMRSQGQYNNASIILPSSLFAALVPDRKVLYSSSATQAVCLTSLSIQL